MAAAAGAAYVPYTLLQYEAMIDRAAHAAYLEVVAGGAVPPAPKTLRKQTLHLDPQQRDRRSPREDASSRVCHRGNRLWEMQELVAQSTRSRCSFRNRRSPRVGGQSCTGAKHFNVIRRAVSGLCQDFHQFRKQADLRLEVVHLEM